jgi:hypothetical protein
MPEISGWPWPLDWISEWHTPHLVRPKKTGLWRKKLMQTLKAKFDRYPESFVFDFAPNPTSYQFGYGALAYTLHYWKRAEYMIRDDNYSPFYLNVYDMLDIVL